MNELNTTIHALGPIVEPLRDVLGVITYILGGVAGIYIIILIYNFWKTRKMYVEISGIKNEIVNVKNQIIYIKKDISYIKNKLKK